MTTGLLVAFVTLASGLVSLMVTSGVRWVLVFAVVLVVYLLSAWWFG